MGKQSGISHCPFFWYSSADIFLADQHKFIDENTEYPKEKQEAFDKLNSYKYRADNDEPGDGEEDNKDEEEDEEGKKGEKEGPTIPVTRVSLPLTLFHQPSLQLVYHALLTLTLTSTCFFFFL